MSFATHTPKPSASKNANGQLKGARFANSSLDKTTRKVRYDIFSEKYKTG